MAEVLGTVASGFAIVSLAIQIAETIHKLKAFHSLMQSAPSDILLAIEELETLSMVLEDVDRSMQDQLFLDPRVKSAVMRSWRLCKGAVDGLVGLVGRLEEGLGKGKGKIRAGFRVAMKKGEIDDFRKRIESAKTTMQLANQIYYQATQSQRWESLERDVLDLRRSHEQNHSIIEREVVQIRTLVLKTPRWSGACSKKMIGSINALDEEGEDEDFDGTLEKHNTILRCRKTQQQPRGKKDGRKFFSGLLAIVISADEHNTTTSVSFELPRWIYARRFELRLMKSRQGWDQSFRSYRTVSYGAKVFDCCIYGDVVALQQLFASGEASPFEIDPDGRTPLHYAALYAHPHVCNFLLDQGADVNVRTSWYGEFSQRLADVEMGKGWYLHIGNIPKGDVFRGWPAYSTPLHILLNSGQLLIEHGRRALSMGHSQPYSGSMAAQDFETTVQALVTSGTDLMLEDQYARTAFHAYTGSTSAFHWLVQKGEWDIRTTSKEEKLDMVISLASSYAANLPELIGHFATEKLTHVSTDGTNIIHVIISVWAVALQREQSSSRGLESLIVDLIHGGVDLHATDSDISTPLLVLLEMMKGELTGSVYVRRWLEILDGAGIDLVAYGRIENEMHDNHKTEWTFWRNIETTDGHKNECCFELVELRIGKTPDDFYLEFEDLYVSASLAARFWNWAEAPSVEERMEAMPGSWKD
ncbi:hypothetical protein BKA65DRAFT_102195 [Rhexocercosporidium sp. MPI-PUGE-AT-0058]|nr:hypothetical protein BKA65DRAFT_102195 [Rhexocercosporidium sp. MPI-PUGE-AT-0058]